ncbi:sarcosine oxidase subunit alpha [Inquilinus sp. CAU 1745]|uniref:sarcosine oxidase subunit alpha n=1 Tax=Inquilinus sp. CAU 1745 TaxID=3140369 RepID=UPI00325B8B56
MSGQLNRLPSGGRIDRTRAIGFRFNGRTLTGHAGDTLASALLANDVHLVGRSFKYHRPRGIVTAGAEEPNALVQVGDDPARTDPNIRATQAEIFDGFSARSQNCWPSVEFDIGTVNDALSPLFPAGFYYKTFMWPKSLWMTYEGFIRRAAGLGESPRAPDPDRYDHVNAHCDVLVIGGGATGLAAALAAGRTGARVILCDEQSEPGGALLSERPDGVAIGGNPAEEWRGATLAELAAMPEVRLLPRTTGFGYYGDNFVGLLERVTDHLPVEGVSPGTPRQRFWKVRAKQVVLATGGIERPLVFAGNDRPGVMLAGAVRTYLNRYAVAPGRRVALLTNNDGAYRTALDLLSAGCSVEGIVDIRPSPEGALVRQARDGGIPILAGYGVAGTEGRNRVTSVKAMRLSADGSAVERGLETRIDCDLLAVSGGWNPAVHLFSQSRGKLAFEPERATFVPKQSHQAERSAGGCNGAVDLASCIAEGLEAGAAAARECGFDAAAPSVPDVEEPAFAPQRNLWLLPSDRPAGKVKAFVDLQNDVTAKDIKLAVREGFRSVEHVKRYTTTGMGTDQGKIGNVNALGIVAGALGADMPSIGVTTFRPPYTPVTFGAIAGRNTGRFLAPLRKTPMDSWQAAHGAAFENVGGGWRRAWYYPKDGEDMHAAVQREAKAARESVGIFDGTTLGKIDIQGRDTAEFLNRIYTNAWTKLEPGRCRYGLMLGEDGMVKDDGVTARLAEDRFHMTTTTGGAAAVMGWLEEWLQTEWPELKVRLTSVTEQWAVITLNGPRSRDVLAELTDTDLSNEAFPHLSVKEATIAGVPGRIFRISFSGEMCFEINVPASFGLSVWEAAWEAGQKHGMTPYGTETMHVLRAEKGFIIVGQETDGTMTPDDLGMGWIIGRKKPDFLGKRSLTRRDMVRDDRKQLVGLETDDPSLVLVEGAHLIADEIEAAPPVPILGHVTSSYRSPTLGRSIALALVKGGREKMGRKLYVAMPDRTIPVTIVDPVFVDREGARLHG